MSDDVTEEMMILYLRKCYPIKRVRFAKSFGGVALPLEIKNSNFKNSNFKRVIRINKVKVFRISNSDERFQALHELASILCRTFHVVDDDTIPVLKRHLHIK